MLASDFFTAIRLQETRDEIIAEGFVADKFLADDPDRPVFGVNLACLYPFPAEVTAAYETFAAALSWLDPGVYIYPIWETHVTIATLINFTKHQSAPAGLDELMQNLITQLESVFGNISRFELTIEAPVISRKAAILPLSDPTNGISRIRNQLVAALAEAPTLRTSLEGHGLNIPPLVHSTIMRFKRAPKDPQLFLSRFDEIARTVPRAVMRVKEIYITTETKPYMRDGEIMRRYQL